MQQEEHALQDQIRLAISEQRLGTIFRANVGQGWQGKVQKMNMTSGSNTIIISNPRPFNTGLPVGFPDLFGLVPVAITPDMVGQTVAVFTAIEVKNKRRKASREQRNMLEFLQTHGARAGIARSISDAVKILQG